MGQRSGLTRLKPNDNIYACDSDRKSVIKPRTFAAHYRHSRTKLDVESPGGGACPPLEVMIGSFREPRRREGHRMPPDMIDSLGQEFAAPNLRDAVTTERAGHS